MEIDLKKAFKHRSTHFMECREFERKTRVMGQRAMGVGGEGRGGTPQSSHMYLHASEFPPVSFFLQVFNQ